MTFPDIFKNRDDDAQVVGLVLIGIIGAGIYLGTGTERFSKAKWADVGKGGFALASLLLYGESRHRKGLNTLNPALRVDQIVDQAVEKVTGKSARELALGFAASKADEAIRRFGGGEPPVASAAGFMAQELREAEAFGLTERVDRPSADLSFEEVAPGSHRYKRRGGLPELFGEEDLSEDEITGGLPEEERADLPGGLPLQQDPQPAPPASPPVLPDQEQLESMKVAELRRLARAVGLRSMAHSAAKVQLVEALSVLRGSLQ